MGVDNSEYRFKESENLETILRLASSAFDSTTKPKLRLTIRSTKKQSIQNIAAGLDCDFLNYGLHFKTRQLELSINELTRYHNDFKSLFITLPNSAKSKHGSTRMSYHQPDKSTSAYIGLPYESKEELLMQLTDFLKSINDHTEFGLEDENEIFQFANTMYHLNQQVRSQDKWNFETGCIDFKPINGRINKDSEKTTWSINGLKVQFSKIHAMAYKAKGIIDLSKILINSRKILAAEFHINSEIKSTLSVIDPIPLDEVSCYFYYSLKDLESLRSLEWLMKENECTIELSDCKFNKNDDFEFSLSISGDSINDLDLSLFIDFQSPIEFKEKVLNLFEGKMHHVGNG